MDSGRAAVRFVCAGVLGIPAVALGQSCPVLPLHTSPVKGHVRSSAVVREAVGERLYVAGDFEVNGQSTSLVRRTGATWEPVPGAPASLSVLHAAELDGAALLIGATDTHIWQYDGASWTSFDPPPDPVLADYSYTAGLIAFDPDGAGPQPPALHVLRSNWRMNYWWYLVEVWGTVHRRDPGGAWVLVGHSVPTGRMAVVDPDGSGPAPEQLYIAGTLGSAFENDPLPQVIRRFSSGTWETIGRFSGAPVSLQAFDPDGPGPQSPLLVVGGGFTSIYQPSTQTHTQARAIASWNGQEWAAFPASFNSGAVHSLEVFDADGAGPAPARLVAAGTFSRAGGDPANALAIWNNTSWEEFGGGATGPRLGEPASVHSLRSFDPDGPGPAPPGLLVSANGSLNGRTAGPLSVWESGGWSDLLDGPGGPVRTLAIFNDGSGRRLFAAGQFTYAGPLTVNNIARWDGQQWSALGTGIEPTAQNPHPSVLAMTVHNDGSGWALYAAGAFRSAGGVPVSNIARWNGTSWSGVGAGISGGPVHALEAHDPDGPGPLPRRLYAAGAFQVAGGAPARKLAYWDGLAWHAVPGIPDAPGAIRTIRTWSEPGGQVLYVGGDPMTVGGLPQAAIFKLGPGGESGWQALPHFDVGARVYAIGFQEVGGQHRVFVTGALGWNTAAAQLAPSGWEWILHMSAPWQSVRYAARSVDDGFGPALYVDSARISATSVQQLSPTPSGEIRAISPVFDDGNGPGIFIAGDFAFLSDAARSSRIAVVRVCQTCLANCDHSTEPPVLNAADLACFLQRFSAGDPWANCDRSTTPPTLTINDFVCFLQKYIAGCP